MWYVIQWIIQKMRLIHDLWCTRGNYCPKTVTNSSCLISRNESILTRRGMLNNWIIQKMRRIHNLWCTRTQLLSKTHAFNIPPPGHEKYFKQC